MSRNIEAAFQGRSKLSARSFLGINLRVFLHYLKATALVGTLLVLLTAYVGCSLIDIIIGKPPQRTATKVTEQLDRAIDELGQAPENVENILAGLTSDLDNLKGGLTDDVERQRVEALAEVNKITTNLVGALGIEIRCDIDFLGRRVQQRLEDLFYSLLGEDHVTAAPTVCTVSPSSLDVLNIKVIDFFGYDFISFGKENFAASIVYNDGTFFKKNIGALSFPSNYQMQLNLQSAELINVDRRKAPKIVVRWKNSEVGGESSLAVKFPDKPKVTLSIDPPLTSVKRGTKVKISWTSQNAQSLTASGSWFGKLLPISSGSRNVEIEKRGDNIFKVQAVGFGNETTLEQRIVKGLPKDPPTWFASDPGRKIASNASNEDLFGLLKGSSASNQDQVVKNHLMNDRAVVIFFKDPGFHGEFRLKASRTSTGELYKASRLWSNDADSFLFFAPEKGTTEKLFILQVFADYDFQDDNVRIAGPYFHAELEKIEDYCDKCPGDVESFKFYEETD